MCENQIQIESKRSETLVNFPLSVLQIFLGFCARSAMWLFSRATKSQKCSGQIIHDSCDTIRVIN